MFTQCEWLLLLPPASMIVPAPVMSPDTLNAPSMLTSPTRVIWLAVTRICSGVTSNCEPPTVIVARLPSGNAML
ncbi:hypothetical protein D3C71_1626710 [compost metagenome]